MVAEHRCPACTMTFQPQPFGHPIRECHLRILFIWLISVARENVQPGDNIGRRVAEV
jgi:hypothetical protein